MALAVRRQQFEPEYTPPTVSIRYDGIDDHDVPRLPAPPFPWRRRAHRWALLVSFAVNLALLEALVRIVVGRR